jgi:hypothetical protein
MSPRRAGAAIAVLGAALLWAGTGTSLSGWTAASVANQTNNAANASLAFTHSYPTSTTCSVTARQSGSVTCTGTPSPAAQVTAGGVSAADSITNNGTLTAAQLVSDFRGVSCAPAKLVDSKTASDPMLPRFATGFRQTDPWGTSGSIAFSGGSAYGADVVATNTGSLLGGNYAIGIWFKVANGYTSGGALMSLDASAVDGTSAAGSPLLWMDTSGKIRFRVTGTLGTSSSGVSAAAYNDGNWHFAVLSVASAIVSTPTLYVDNASGVTTAGLTALTGGNAYWHLGWGDFTGVSAPTSTYLTGSLAGAFVVDTSMSSATRTSLFGSASASAYSTAVLALSLIDHLWMADDTGTTTYSGSLPTIGATSPCTMVDIGWATTSPAGTVVASGTKLSAFANGTFHTITAPAPGSTQTSTITLSRDATWNAYVSGLRLYLPLEHRVQAATGGIWLSTFSWASSSAVAIS